jgi:hypothetical protein
MTVFIRAIEAPVDDKAGVLLRSVEAVARSQSIPTCVFSVSPASFAAVPGSPFAYWVSDRVRWLFERLSRFESAGRIARHGLATHDDFRWLRLSWEVAPLPSDTWAPMAKGGAYSPTYSDIHLVLLWGPDGRWLKASKEDRLRRGEITENNSKLWSESHYFRPGLTWPRRTDGLSFRILPAGCIFADKGPAAFVEGDAPEILLALNAIMNSRVFGYLVCVQLARTELAQSYEVGIIQQTPIPELSAQATSALARLARRAWSLRRCLDTSNEHSHAFELPLGMNEKTTAVDESAVQRELARIQSQIDETVFSLYGISAEDRASIEASAKQRSSSDSAGNESTDDADEAGEDVDTGSSEAIASWLVGAAFGRFDPRLATGERAIPPEPEPFDPLPSRSPGMYPEGEEPADRPDILVDDEGHADDLAARAIAVAERVKVDAPENLRAWLAKEFFPQHIRMYSKSRRKAPIYWQLATPSARYSAWLYIHTFSKDSLFRVQNDCVAPKLAHEERRLESLTSELRDGATAAQRKTLAAQEAVVDELRAFLDEVKRVAPLWRPNLEDGVIINFAPLWRLVPQNKSWQKELKSTWDALCEGEYDWAHLAMHLWPERVVSKCAKDRSLAIAHGLEDVFWVEGTDGKWTARKTPTKSVDELVKERTSPAVKSALKSLLEAPVASGMSTGRKGGGRRKAAAAAEGGDA